MLNWKPVEFFQKGCNITHFVKSEDNAAKMICIYSCHPFQMILKSHILS